MLTGHNDAAAAVEAVATGADDLLAKPVAVDLLAARIERTIDRAQRIAELKRSNAMLDARIATRATELGEARTELAERREDSRRPTGSEQSSASVCQYRDTSGVAGTIEKQRNSNNDNTNTTRKDES